MYSILLVDDERSLRESISELVHWEENGFELMGMAENGLDALQLIEEVGAPDLLITDIKMPVMDGLELVKRVKQDYPTVKVVFLSGYDEFQYAVAGIELSVFQYLLKPVSEMEIEEMLRNVERQITEEIRVANDMNIVKKAYFEKIEVMKISFLVSLLTDTYSNVSPVELAEFIETYDLRFLDQAKILFTIQMKEDLDHQELVRFSLSNQVRTIMEKYTRCEVFLFSSSIICLMEEPHDASVIAKEIVESAKKLMGQAVYIGVSEPFKEVFHTKKAYRQAMEAVEYARYSDKSKIIHVTDIEGSENQSELLESLNEYTLQLAIKTGDKKTIDQLLDQTKMYNSERPQTIHTVASVVYITVMRSLAESGIDIQAVHTDWFHTFMERSSYQSYSAAIHEVRAFCYAVMDEIISTRTQYTHSLVDKGIQYIKMNYQDPDISLQSVSRHLALSPTYFSAIFKKETGQSFIDMLTELKMNRAKELVLTTEAKMFEIALACGYKDQHYFSYSFKKFFGTSPTKMRRELEV